jgi:hypothetical protein
MLALDDQRFLCSGAHECSESDLTEHSSGVALTFCVLRNHNNRCADADRRSLAQGALREASK